jgi:hypothetical protein
MSKLEQFRKQQALREQLANRPLLYAAAAPEDVAALLAKQADSARLASLDYHASLSLTLQTAPNDARELLRELEQEFDQARVSDLLAKAQRDIIGAIAGPLGLGKFLAVYDKQGGNVTTVHNAQQDIYANPDVEKYYRNDYDRGLNSQGKRFAGAEKKSVGATFTRGQLDKEQKLRDGYTGEKVKGDLTSPDHIIPLKTYHQNGGFMQSKTQRADFGTDTANLISTQRHINNSMSDDEKLEWLERKSSGRQVTNEEYYKVDRKLVENALKRGQETADRHAPGTSEKAAYYTAHAAQTGMTEGLKMGSQQAFGMLMVELFSSALDEIKDLYRNGRQSDTILAELGERLNRVGVKVAARWEQMLHSFSGGFISGFVSNAVNVMINLFVTTGKRAVRMMREGIFSLLKALKTFLFPPKDMTFSQAAHEALKLLAAGGVVVGGVALEEAAEKLILGVPLFAPFAGVLTAVLVGAATALSMTFVCYLLDKIDLFGAVRAERDKQMIGALDTRIDAQMTLSMCVIEELDGYLLTAPSPA